MTNYLTDGQLEAVLRVRDAKDIHSLELAIDQLETLQKTGDLGQPVLAALNSRMNRYIPAGRNAAFWFAHHLNRDDQFETAKLILAQELIRILLQRNGNYPHPEL